MTMRLETVAKNLSEKLRIATPEQQKAASYAACQLALQASSVDAAIVLESVAQLKQYGTLSAQRVIQLRDLAEQLDSKYFDLQEQSGINSGSLEGSLRLFGQARTVAAVAFAGGAEVLTAVMESIYEASMAVDDREKVFEAALAACSRL